MSPEEEQVLFDQWGTVVMVALGNVRACADQIKDDNEIADLLDDTTKLLNTLAGDISKLVWSAPDVAAARNLIACYVQQTNAERQARRDADLERHKEMVNKQAEKRIIEGLAAAEAQAAKANERAQEIIVANEKLMHHRRNELHALFEKQVEAAVQERLLGAPDSATPGRTKRPIIVG